MKNLTALILSATIAGATLSTAVCAQEKAAAASAVDKTMFVTMAASSNMLEIQSSQMALERAKSEDVKAFANQMIQDHTKATEEMTALLQKKGMTPPATMEAKHQQLLQGLADDKSNFDKAYAELQRAAHEEAVGLFSAYAGSPDDSDLGAFAQKTLPTLQVHLEHANALKAQ